MKIERLPDDAVPADLDAFYNDVASRVDAWQPTMFKTWPDRARFERVVELATGAVKAKRLSTTCLEIGCAEGMMTTHLAPHFATVDAVDISQIEISRAARLPNVRFFCNNAETMTPPRKRYDVVVMAEVLEHMRDPRAAIQRYASIAGLLVASGPITEKVNPAGAFDASLIGREFRQADATGHIWYMDMDGFRSLFDGMKIVVAEQIKHCGVIAARRSH